MIRGYHNDEDVFREETRNDWAAHPECELHAPDCEFDGLPCSDMVEIEYYHNPKACDHEGDPEDQ